MDHADLVNRFTYHPPDEGRAAEHAGVRTALLQLAFNLDRALPDGREKSLVVTHLEEAMFWANAALARIDEDGNRR